MKRFTIILSVMLLCASSLFAQNIFFGNKKVKASNVYVTKDIRVSDFDRIQLSGSMDMVYEQKSGKPSLEIYASDNIVNLLEVDVEDGLLTIRFKKGYSISSGKVQIRATSANLYGVSLAGSGSIDLSKGIKTNHLTVQLSGSGDVMGKNIFCQEDLRVAISGSGDVDMQQLVCNQFGVSLSGSGDVEINNIDANNAKVSVAGSGDMKLRSLTCAKANVEVAGSGCIEMYGKSNDAQFEVAGSGEISAAGFEAKQVVVSIAGSGDVECYATDYLKASIAGSGEVGYKGNPELNVPKRGVHKL